MVSVIIPTYNGEKKISATLNALLRQSIQNFEVIIVIDGSTDNTFDLVKSYENKFPSLIIINQRNGGRSVARNVGVKASNHPLLLFLDDDIEVDATNVEKHLRFHQEDRESVLVGSPRFCWEKVKNDPFLMFRARAEESWSRSDNSIKRRITLENYSFTTQNLSLSRDLFIKIGLFDERLTDSEDFDLSLRLLKEGKSVFFDQGLVCYHNDFADLPQTIRRQLQYYRSKIKLLQLHPEYRSMVPQQFEWLSSGSKDFAKEFIFQFRFFWEPVFKTKLFRFFPEAFRRLVYSGFIYTHSVLVAKKEFYNARKS